MSATAALRVFYGGTFDPVHDGHLAVALAARDALGVGGQPACIDIVPAADPPHRAPPGASAVDRVRMLELAIGASTGLRLDHRELERHAGDATRPSWTVDTLRALRSESGARAPIAWLVGADSFIGLPTWKCWRELFGLAHFVVAARPGSRLDATLPAPLVAAMSGRWVADPEALRRSPAGLVWQMDQPLHAHSATDVRQRIAAGLPWRSLVPAAVADYITEHKLYGAGRGTPPERSEPPAPL